MTVKELKEEIKEDKESLSSGDILLDSDYLFKIGLEYKSLNRKEKLILTWQQLVDYLDIDNWSGNAYRCWVNGQIKKGKKIDQIELPDSKGKDQKFDSQHYEKITQLRDYWRAIRSEKRDNARIEELKDLVVNTAAELSKLPIHKYIYKEAAYTGEEILKRLNSTKEAILMFSDLHLGVIYHSQYNNYGDTIASKRLGVLAANVKNYCTQNKVQVLNIVNLGDMIQGIIHTNARINVQFDAITQTMAAAEMIANFLSLIQDVAPLVTYRSCTDNHSRIMANKDESIEDENLYRIIDWWLEERLKSTSIVFQDDNIDQGLGKFLLQNGQKVMFAHGHQDTDNQVFQHFIGASREFIDYALIGHYHSYKAKDYQNMTVIVNGSIVGTEQYANSMRLYSKPSQTLLIFDGPNLITYKIDLSEVQE